MNRVRLTIVVIVALLATATLASAHGDVPFPSPNVIHGCRNQNTGALRQITSGTCANGETIVHWNITGPAGTNGANGTNGTNGTNGASVTSVALSQGDANCPNGGSQFTSANGTTYACNGQNATGATNPDPPCFDNTNRYVDCANGTVTDTVTGLIWLKQPNCLSRNAWAAANQAAAAVKDGDCGLTDHSSAGDWRLPTRDEWSATVARAVALGCTLSGAGGPPSLTNDAGTACYGTGAGSSFAGVASTAAYLSSSTYESNPVLAWGVFLGQGSVDFVDVLKVFTTRVWPVRGGPR